MLFPNVKINYNLNLKLDDLLLKLLINLANLLTVTSALKHSLNIYLNNGILIYQDNSGYVKIENNPGSDKLAKHIDIKYHHTIERVVRVEYIITENRLVDIFTKPLGPIKFLSLKKCLELE